MIRVKKGNGPLLICLPHTGAAIPPAVESRMSATGRLKTDMSWHLDQVFDLSEDLDATVIYSTISKLVADVDRAPTDFEVGEDSSTSCCPTLTLDGKKIYKYEEEPGAAEHEQRLLLFHDPFHKAIDAEIARLKQQHSEIAVFDCQSMRSRIKGFCDRGLPMVSLGTAEGKSCDAGLKDVVAGCFMGVTGFSIGIDDLFTGGHITRTYGDPRKGVHAMTIVVAQRAYLRHETPPFEPDRVRVQRLKGTMEEALSKVVNWTQNKKGSAPTSPAPLKPGNGSESELVVSEAG